MNPFRAISVTVGTRITGPGPHSGTLYNFVSQKCTAIYEQQPYFATPLATLYIAPCLTIPGNGYSAFYEGFWTILSFGVQFAAC